MKQGNQIKQKYKQTEKKTLGKVYVNGNQWAKHVIIPLLSLLFNSENIPEYVKIFDLLCIYCIYSLQRSVRGAH